MQEFPDTELEPFAVDGLTLPLLRLNDIDLPATLIKVGEREYRYDRSYPFKGYGAIMPKYVAEQTAQGREPLVVERMDRYYLYFAVESSVPAASS
jgi:hypothetical protein